MLTLCTHDPTLDILIDHNPPQSFACHDSLTVMCSTIHLSDSTLRCSAGLLTLPACQNGVLISLPALHACPETFPGESPPCSAAFLAQDAAYKWPAAGMAVQYGVLNHWHASWCAVGPVCSARPVDKYLVKIRSTLLVKSLPPRATCCRVYTLYFCVMPHVFCKTRNTAQSFAHNSQWSHCSHGGQPAALSSYCSCISLMNASVVPKYTQWNKTISKT